MKILRDGSTFSLEFVSGENYEVIDVRPGDWLNGFLLHDIKKGKYDEEKHAYRYRRYAGIFNGADSLVNSYYGIGISNSSFSLEAQKRLQRNNLI